MLLVTTTEESPCAECARLYGATCCSRKDGDGPRMPITYGDAALVSRWAGKDGISGVVSMPCDEGVIADLLGEEAALLVVHGRALYLPTLPNGDCLYLGPKGCTIPSAKPAVCSLFPFKPSAAGQVSLGYVGQPGYCYGQDIGQDDLTSTMKVFGETLATLQFKVARWRTNLRQHRMLFSQWQKRSGLHENRAPTRKR